MRCSRPTSFYFLRREIFYFGNTIVEVTFYSVGSPACRICELKILLLLLHTEFLVLHFQLLFTQCSFIEVFECIYCNNNVSHTCEENSHLRLRKCD